MVPATVEAPGPVEGMEDGKAEETSFLSRATDKRIIVRPGIEEIRNPAGHLVQPANQGYAPQFEAGRLTTELMRRQAALQNVPEDEREIVVQEAINKIRSLDEYNVANYHGVWEESRPPDEAKPTITEQLNTIITAVNEVDRATLDRLLADEESGHNRAVVMDAARTARSGLGEEPDESAP